MLHSNVAKKERRLKFMAYIPGYEPPLGPGDASSPITPLYNAAVDAFSDLFAIADSPGYLLMQKRGILLTTLNDPSATPEQKTAAQNAYDQALAYFLANTPNLTTTLDSFLTHAGLVLQMASDHVSWVTQQSLNALAVNDAYIQQNLPTIGGYFGNPLEPLPAWLLAKAAPNTAAALTDEGQAFLDACNAYRAISLQIATTRNTFFHSFVDYLKNYSLWQQSGNQADLDNAIAAWNTSIQLENSLPALLAQRTSLGATIDATAANYGEPLLSAIKATQDWSSFLEKLQQPMIDAMNLAAAQKQAANEAALAAHLALYPTDADVESVNKSVAYYTDQLKAMTLAAISNIDFPTLPSTNAKLSISILSKILSQIQLMISQLSDLIELADSNLNLFRSRTQSLDLLAGATKTLGSPTYMDTVVDADNSYNATVTTQNFQQINNLSTVLHNYTDNLPQITAILDNVNVAIDLQNYYVAEYTQESTELIENGLSGVSAALYGTKDFFYASTFWNCWKESPYGTFSGDDLSEKTHAAAENVTIPSGSLHTIPHLTLAPIPQIQVGPDGIPLTDPASMSALNASVLEFARSIAPIYDLIQQIPGSPNLNLSEVVLASTIPPRSSAATFLNMSFLVDMANTTRAIINKDRRVRKKQRKTIDRIITSINRFITKITNVPAAATATTAAAVSFAIGPTGIGTDLLPSDLGKIINDLIQAEILYDTIRHCLERVAMRAGLILAGELPSELSSSMGITSTELYESLGVDILKNLDLATTRALFLIMAEQLALTAIGTPALLTQAEALISKLGDKKLTKEDIKDLLATLVMFQQMIYLFLAMLMGSLGGMNGTQMLTEIFAALGGTASGTISAFEALGFPKDKAIVLATALGGDTTTFQQLLRSLGLDTTASSIILALFAAQKGSISLTHDVPGGPALISAMLTRLAEAGIVLKERVLSPEFMNALIQALELRATEAGKEILHEELNRIANIAYKGFEALGFPESTAQALISVFGGNISTLDTLLQSLGLNKGTSAIILALLAAQKGGISLTEDFPNGPAAIKAMILKLVEAGLIVKEQIQSEDLLKEIIASIELQASETQKEALREELRRVETLAAQRKLEMQGEVEPPYDAFDAALQSFLEALTKVFKEPEKIPLPVEQPTPYTFKPPEVFKEPEKVPLPEKQPTPYSFIKPSEVFKEITTIFKTAPQPVQNELIQIAQSKFSSLNGVSDEQKAALLFALMHKQLSMTEAMSLLFLTRLEALDMLGKGNVMNDIIKKLFTESPEAVQAREDAIKQGIILDDINRRERIVDHIQYSFKQVFHNIENKQFALVAFERFAKFVENLTNIAKMYSDRLLSPATIILRNFSILTRTSQDRLNQPRTILGG